VTDKFTINESWSSPPGKRFSVEVRAQPLTFDLDPAKLGAGPAAAIAQVIRESIEALPDRLFNRTGKLIAGITARLTGDATYAVKAPPDRLERDPALLTRLRELVPVLRDPRQLLEHPTVKKAIEAARDAMITKEKR
jgi:hypothetical protein